MDFIAHIDNNNKVQLCEDHCINTAQYAEDDLKCVNLEKAGYLAGLLHDVGKFSSDFCEYILKAVQGEKTSKGSVIHTFAGASLLLRKYHKVEQQLTIENISAELLAYAVGAHHGLFDAVDENSRNGFIHRLEKQPEYDKKTIENFFQKCCSEQDLDGYFEQASKQIGKALCALSKMDDSEPSKRYQEVLFYEGLLARLILSAVVDGDRRDTAEFMVGRDFSPIINTDKELWGECLHSLGKNLTKMETKTDIQKARKELSDMCAAFSNHPTGIYRLNLPTGAGKTLSGMRFALAHAKKYNKSRIFYVAPLISIIEQNAKIIREAIGNEDIVLEHHSNLVVDSYDEEKLDIHELFSETWGAPIVITTLVQFLNTLFDGKTTAIRRFHSLCNSVIIIDEVQSVPTKMLSMFNLAINFLMKICNATILLCSATQPCLEHTNHSMNISEKSVVPAALKDKFLQIFRRTKIHNAGRFRLKDIPEKITMWSHENKSLLVVCNTKAEAKLLFTELKDNVEATCYHLTSGMCMAHRKDVFKSLKGELENGHKVICISTQVIEAGVDISFEAVVRFQAGIDNIVQTAGRCNRNGESSEVGNVQIINCIDENLTYLSEIKDAKMATTDLLTEYEKKQDDYKNDLASDESVNYYYHSLYRNMKRGHQDYVADKRYPNLFALLSSNDQYVDGNKVHDEFMTHQAFKTAGLLFKVIDTESSSVITPYGEGSDLIEQLCSEKAKYNWEYRKKLINEAKEFSVTLFKYQEKKLKEAKAIHSICEGLLLVLDKEFYDDNLGLIEEGGNNVCNTLIL